MEWHKTELSGGEVKDIAEKYGCDLLTASIFLRRGILSGEEIRYYLESDLRHLRNPFDLPGMEDAVERILAAKEEGEKVMVFGDRDVDGITGTALITGYLRRNGFDVRWRLPAGEDPYGLSTAAVEDFAADYGTLIITVDCGISNREEIARAAELGVSVVVTDHHNPPEALPDAAALVNPKLPGRYGFTGLSGCAVAYKLVSALRFASRSEVYGQAICLLNARPSNDAMIIEIAKIRNLAVTDTLTETVVPGMVNIGETRLPAFLAGEQILCWDLPVQKKLLAQAFGGAVDIQMLDVAGEIGRQIPQTGGKSLLRLKELSRIGRYSPRNPGELDVLVNLFTSFVHKKSALFDGEDGEDLQCAALGTIADIMPLRDENRLIVKKGIEAMLKKPRSGLAELLFKQDLAGRPLQADDIAWLLTPVINAAGRMGRAEKAAALFLAEDPVERDALAAEVSAMNGERKRLVEAICLRAEPEARKSLDRYAGNCAVYGEEGILPGLTGLVASRLADRLKTPALAAALSGDTIRGSLRSVRDYDLSFLLDHCGDLFLRYGGHDFAAGFTMERKHWDTLLDRLEKFAPCMELAPPAAPGPLEIDAEIPLSYLSRLEEDPRTPGKQEPYMLHLASRFEPYGEKNRPLLFCSRGLKVGDISLMGKEALKHVKLSLDTGRLKWPAVYWNAAEKINAEFRNGDTVDVVYRMNRNWFNGAETPQLMIQDLRVSGESRGDPASASGRQDGRSAGTLVPPLRGEGGGGNSHNAGHGQRG
ncbi:MAG: single-stranded-DNA-specific exonuclease RecJ [Treponema sp.]|jgi:single-stranded-DNA-specific exonuclease|nr:single-stranded-DNA-specific exonuclease RecJ [Treponema sp.]